jgi:hypothetical protein
VSGGIVSYVFCDCRGDASCRRWVSLGIEWSGHVKKSRSFESLQNMELIFDESIYWKGVGGKTRVNNVYVIFVTEAHKSATQSSVKFVCNIFLFLAKMRCFCRIRKRA